jgi:outer membrane immunogenic protein
MRNKLISVLAGAAISFAASGFAFAADMSVKTPVKAPPPPPPPVYGWTGWYVGVNAGASFGNARTDFNVAPVTTNIASIPIPGFGAADRVYPRGPIGGGQIGYNWQLSPIWVVGLEADLQGAVEKDSGAVTHFFDFPIGPPGDLTGSTVTNYEAKIEWFGTARLRAGFLWGNGVLSYVTGGLAYGQVDIEGTSTVSGTGPGGSFPFAITHVIGHSNTNAGWVVGCGTEGPLAIPGWTWKVEGLYVDLGTLDATGVTSAVIFTPTSLPGGVTGGQVTTHTHFTDGILRVGLNYKFH